MFAVLSRAPLRVGFGINPARFGLYTHLVPYDTQGPEREQFMRLVTQSGIGKHAENAESAENAEGRSTGFVLCHAGGAVEAKLWPAEAFAEFCVKLHEKTGLPCVFVGGKEDKEYAREIIEFVRKSGGPEVPAWLQNRVGLLSLDQTAAACREAAVLVGPDSGIAHLAVAVGTPAVVLFGPSDPGKWGPPAGRGEAVRVSVPCAPCSMFGSVKPCRRRVCMERISPDRVLAAVEKFLPSAAGAGSASASEP